MQTTHELSQQSPDIFTEGSIEYPMTDVEAAVVASEYDELSEQSGWDSPERAQTLVGDYIKEGSVVLDLGVGTGQAVRGYAEKGALVIGFDHDSEMLEVAQAVTGESGNMRLADINEPLPVDDLYEQVDVVQAVGVLEFASDLGNILAQVESTLKSDGVFVFTTEVMEESNLAVETFPEAGVTIYRHTVDEVKQLLEEIGLKVVTDEGYGGYARDDVADKVPYHIFLVQKS